MRGNFIARFGGRSAAIRLMLVFCSAQPYRPITEPCVLLEYSPESDPLPQSANAGATLAPIRTQ
jgi:hypothetical protein